MATEEDYVPLRYEGGIPHYHGDAVRQLLVVAATFILIAAPFYGSSLRVELPFEIAGALVLVALAALANPHNKGVFLGSAVASGVGLIIYGTWALSTFGESNWLQFILRDAIAIVFLAAFYFSMKTVRAFVLRKVGKHGEAGEFERSNAGGDMSPKAWRDEFVPWFLRNKSGRRRSSSADSGSSSHMSPGRTREEIMPKAHPYEEQL